MEQGHGGGKSQAQQGAWGACISVETAVEEHGTQVHVGQSFQGGVVGGRNPPGSLS